MLKEENEDFLKSLKKRSKHGKEEDKDDDMSDEEVGEASGDPQECKAAFKVYLLNVLTSNELD